MNEKILQHSPIHYWTDESKSNKAILFIHPAFGTHACFDGQLKAFEDCKVITMDLLGHGKSIGEGKIENTAEYICEIMAEEGLERINLVGVSIGAVLSQDFANRYPEKVASLTGVGGYDINNFPAELQRDNGNRQIRMMMKAMFSIKAFAEENRKNSAYTKEAQDRFYKMNLDFNKSSFRYLASLGKMINRTATAERNYPLLIGVGEHDNEMAKKAAELWHDSEPQSIFVTFENAGHIANMDNPEQFNAVLRTIIR